MNCGSFDHYEVISLHFSLLRLVWMELSELLRCGAENLRDDVDDDDDDGEFICKLRRNSQGTHTPPRRNKGRARSRNRINYQGGGSRSPRAGGEDIKGRRAVLSTRAWMHSLTVWCPNHEHGPHSRSINLKNITLLYSRSSTWNSYFQL